MKGPTEQELAAWLEVTMERSYSQFLELRFFAARIVSVFPLQQAYTCRLVKLGDTTSDQHDYLCCTPGYVPQVGDQVECVWKDKNVGYVLWPIGGYLAPRSRVHLKTLQTIGVNWTAVAFDALDWGSYGGGWVLGAGAAYTARLAGNYRVNYGLNAILNNNPQRFTASVFKAAAEMSRGLDVMVRGGTVGADPVASIGSDEIPLNAGDKIQIQAFNGGGANVTLQNTAGTGGIAGTFCTIRYLGP